MTLTKTDIRTMSLFLKFMCCYNFKYFQLELQEMKLIFQVIISYLLYSLHVHLLLHSFKVLPAQKSCVPIINYLDTSTHVICSATFCYLKGMALQETPFKSHSVWKFDNNMNSFWMIWWRFIWNTLLVLNLLPLYFLQQRNNIQLAAVRFSD
jgi:hypothetical protein